MKVFEFSGFGNFSSSFGWDNGLSSTLEQELSFEEALINEEMNCAYSAFYTCLPSEPTEGVFINYFGEQGGTRNVSGWVIAQSQQQAIKILRKFDDSYEVVEYEQ